MAVVTTLGSSGEEIQDLGYKGRAKQDPELGGVGCQASYQNRKSAVMTKTETAVHDPWPANPII